MSKRKPSKWAMKIVLRLFNTYGFDGTEKFLNLMQSNCTFEEAFAGMMPFVERAAKQPKLSHAHICGKCNQIFEYDKDKCAEFEFSTCPDCDAESKRRRQSPRR
jgi:hypothetical protein